MNIHARENPLIEDDYNSFIELITTDLPEKRYKISKNDVTINTDTDAKFTNYASDFINYRMLLGISAFRHSYKIDLFLVFAEDILKYVQFSKVKITRNGEVKEFTNAFEIWQQIELGHETVDSINSSRPRKIRAYKNSKEWHEFEDLITSFNTSLKKLIDYINIHAPSYFEKLGYDFLFFLELEREAYYIKKDTSYEYIPFVLRIKIPEYKNEINALHKPHSFLNEAKLSAIAISIRLAVLSIKRQENCLKFIVLDDLLVSLDMSNREKVLDVFLSDEFSTNYQLIILTHDIPFFQLCKRKISDLNQTNWTSYEMYVDEDNVIPVLLPSDTSYAKACNHLKKFDYAAAGNYFRKATEELFENYFPREVTIADTGEKRTTLRGYIDTAIKLYERISQSANDLKILDNYLFLLLNPLSHRAIDTNVYKTELNRIKLLLPEIVKNAQKQNLRELIAANNSLVISFKLNQTTYYEYFIKTVEPIYLYNNEQSSGLTNSKCESYESSTTTNEGEPVFVKNERYKFDNLLELHKAIFIKNNTIYDNSLMTSIFHIDQQSKRRISLKELSDTL